MAENRNEQVLEKSESILANQRLPTRHTGKRSLSHIGKIRNQGQRKKAKIFSVSKRKNPGITAFSRNLKGTKTTDSLDQIVRRLHRPIEDANLEPDKDKNNGDTKSIAEARKIFGSKAQEVDGMYQIDGMATYIYDFQLVGAGFMVRHERARNGPLGGILADDMGMGKTIQAIACMVTQRPSKKQSSHGEGATLVVVPNAGIMKQWKGELEKHVSRDEGKEVFEYTGRSVPAQVFKSCKYVFATYGKILQEHRSRGTLFSVNFHRVILDEGDKIKNLVSSTSIACRELHAKSKWVISATPLQNSVDEIYPYLDFLGIDPSAPRADFEKMFGELSDDTEKDRIERILSNRMIYRRKGELFLGKPICPLPPYHCDDKIIPMPERERLLYECIETRIRTLIKEKMMQNEISGGGYGQLYFTLTTRLRQAVDHPFLLEKCMVEILTKDDISSLKEKIKNTVKTTDQDVVDILCETISTDDFLEKSNLIDYFDHVLESKAGMGSCIECNETDDLHKLDCKHTICRDCFYKLPRANENTREFEVKCPECHKFSLSGNESNAIKEEHLETTTLFDALSSLGSPRTYIEEHTRIPSQNRRIPSAGDDFNGYQPKTQSQWLEKCDNKPKDPISPSAKTKAVIDTIREIIRNSAGDKMIVFLQWGVTAKILGRMLNLQDIGFVYYWGDMSGEQRSANLDVFHNKEKIKVMLASLKCGNAGLNITCANHVILMTPWWNYSVEQQAFGRVYRHGQQKETYFVRIAVENTIDERVLAMQAQKEADIATAMKNGRKVKPLTAEESIKLLGGSEEDNLNNDSDGSDGSDKSDESEDSDSDSDNRIDG